MVAFFCNRFGNRLRVGIIGLLGQKGRSSTRCLFLNIKNKTYQRPNLYCEPGNIRKKPIQIFWA